MTISIGVVGIASSIANPATMTTSSVNSAASGSGFVATLVTVTGTTTTVTPTIADAFGNTYTKASQLSFISGGSSYLVDRFYINPGASGYVGGGTAHTCTVTINIGGGSAPCDLWLTLHEMPGAASGTGNFYGSAASHTYPFSHLPPYASTSLLVTPPSGGAVLLSTLSCGSPSSGTGSDSTGFTVALTSALSNAGGAGGAIGTNVVTATNTYTPSWTWTPTTGVVEAFETIDSFFGLSPAIYDGTTASGTTVATGTGGTALPAFNVGDCIHVLIMMQTSSALTDSGPSDGHNTYVNLQTADNHGTTGFIFDRWMTIVTVPLTTPIISTTLSGTCKAAIAVAKLSGINTSTPNVSGGNAQQHQTTPSGTNTQSSAATISQNPLVPVTLGAWGFSVSEGGAPAAGTGFTQIGTAWAALGSACLTYETQTSNTVTRQSATFTPIGASDTYTFLDVFNQIGAAPPALPPGSILT